MDMKDNSIKILAFSPFPPDVSGGAKASYEIFKLLSRDCHITLFAYKRFSEKITNLNVYSVPLVELNNSNTFMYILRGLSYFTCSVIHSVYLGVLMKPDIIYAKHISTPGLAATIVSKLLRKPLILHTAGGDVQDRYRWDGLNIIYSKGVKLIMNNMRNFCLGSADIIIANSVVDYGCVNDLGFKNIYTIYNGVKTDVFCPSLVGRERVRKNLGLMDSFVIAYSGSASREKNLLLLIKCSELYPNFKFLFIGPSIDDLKSISNIGENCIALGKVKNVQEYLQASDIYIHPSKVEGLSNSVLEAMACGLPVITYPSGDSIYLIKNGVNGFLAKDIGEFKKYINCLFTDKELYYRISVNARKTILDNFSWSNTAKSIYDLFISVKK